MDTPALRTIMVTGGAGCIGSHTVDLLLAQGFAVSVVDNFAPYAGGRRAHVPPGVPLFEVDVSSEDFEALICRERPDGVIHLAAQPSVSVSTEQPLTDLLVNGGGLVRLLGGCALAGVRRVVFASSAAVYGDVEELPVHEDTPQRPCSPYGITKLLGEQYARYWRGQGLSATVLRYSNVYGPRQSAHGEAGVLAIFARQMLLRRPVRIDWDGEQRRDYVYVGDVARANLAALLRGGDGTFCIGSGTGTSVNTVYRLLADALGYEVPVERGPRRPGDIYASYFDCSRAAGGLGWRAEVPLAEGIRRTVAAMRAELLG